MALKKKGLGSLRISRILGIKNEDVVEGWINRGTTPLCLLSKSYANYQNILNNIKSAKDYPEALAHIVGLLNGDGHLQIRKDHSSGISFYSKYLSEVQELDKQFERVFGMKGKIYEDKRKDKGYMLFFHSYELAIFLQSLGIIEGRKTEQEYGIPDWILKADKGVKSAFLRGIFSAEGFVSKKKSKDNEARYRAGITQYKNINIKESCKMYLGQIKTLLEEFGVKCSNVHLSNRQKRKNFPDVQGYKFTFEEKSFENFYRYIKFDNKHKNKRMLEVLKDKHTAGFEPAHGCSAGNCLTSWPRVLKNE